MKRKRAKLIRHNDIVIAMNKRNGSGAGIHRNRILNEKRGGQKKHKKPIEEIE